MTYANKSSKNDGGRRSQAPRRTGKTKFNRGKKPGESWTALRDKAEGVGRGGRVE